MSVDVERLRPEILLSQPAPSPQYDSSPRRSLAVGTRSDKSGVPRAKTQKTVKRGSFPLEASVDGILHVSCTSLE